MAPPRTDFIVNPGSGDVRSVDFDLFPESFASVLVYWGEGGFFVVSRVPPRASGPPAHRHDVDQVFITLRGRLEVQIGAGSHVLVPGRAAHIPAGTPHRHRNDTDEEEVHLELILPGVIPGRPVLELVGDTEAWEGSGFVSEVRAGPQLSGQASGDLVAEGQGAFVAHIADTNEFALSSPYSSAFAFVVDGDVEVLNPARPSLLATTHDFVLMRPTITLRARASSRVVIAELGILAAAKAA